MLPPSLRLPTIAGLINPRSKRKLGWWYEAGIAPIQAHPRKARQWHQRAAKQGNQWTGYRLVWLYENGYGSKKCVCCLSLLLASCPTRQGSFI